jgi:hypothetical protein
VITSTKGKALSKATILDIRCVTYRMTEARQFHKVVKITYISIVKIIIALILSICIFCSYGQTIDVSGKWQGTVSFMSTQSQIHYEFEQESNKIKGYCLIKSLDNTDSTKIQVKGEVKGNKVSIIPVAYVYQSGTQCAAATKLVFSIQNGKEALLGKWKGDFSFLTCPPLISGNITAYKEIVQDQRLIAAVPAPKQSTESTIGTDDALGQALITELSKRNYYALIIGVEQYNEKDISTLDQPVKDAQALAQVLKTYYSFSKENVNVLSNAKRADIIDALDDLSTKVTEKDNLLVFFAGHGVWNERLNQGYWLPSDAMLNSKADWLSNSTIRDYIGGINSKHTLLIADACFSGGILKERAIFENSRAILEVYKLPSRKAMTSGTLKTVPDKSVFMEFLLKNLIQNQAPLLSADQLFRQFKTAVINNSPNGQVPQYGPIIQAGDEGGDFIFLKRTP